CGAGDPGAAPAACGSGAEPLFVLLLGAPGSGKGTQGKILAERLGLRKITTGDILRAAVREGTPLGRQAKKYMDDGKLVPASVIPRPSWPTTSSVVSCIACPAAGRSMRSRRRSSASSGDDHP